MTTTILCTSVGNDGFQAIHRALSASEDRIEIIGVDADPHAYGLYLADHAQVVPSRAQADALLDATLELGRAWGAQLLLPLSTLDQEFYAERRDAFEGIGIRVAASPLPAIRIANSKHRLLEEAAKLGLPVPGHRVAASIGELEAALDALDAERQTVVVKKEFSTGAMGVKIVKPHIDPADRLFCRDNIVITLDDLRRWASRLDPFPSLQVCEFLPDTRYSVDVFLVGGQSRCAVVRSELARHYDMATVGEVVDAPKIQAAGVAVAEALGLEYTVNVQIGLDQQGAPKLVEVNPRFPASIDHTVMAGCNMPRWTVRVALSQPYEVRSPKVGTRYRRDWTSMAPQAWMAPDPRSEGAR